MINVDKLPDDSVNISRENSLLKFTKLLFSLFFIVSLTFWLLQFLINFTVDNISEKSVLKLMGVSSNFISTEYDEDKNLSRVAKKVLKCIKLPFRPKLFVIAGKKANAFALANGDIYITEPLFDKIDSDSELAFIIGHEIGHFKNRDHLKGLGINFIILTFAMLSGDSFNRTLSTIINFQRAKYSQSSEIKADKFGLEGLICAYGSVDGAISIFEKLRNSQDNDYLFSSHPSFEKRLRIIRGWKEKSKIEVTGN